MALRLEYERRVAGFVDRALLRLAPAGRSRSSPAPVVLADANVSVGVAGLVVAIIVLVVVLPLAIIAPEVAGEHWDNVNSRRPH